MGSFGGFAFFGGTSYFGGGIDAEERWYQLLQRWLGEGAYNKTDDLVRSRFLMAVARGLATMESEARKQARESVPSLSIDQVEEWELLFGLDLVRGTFGDLELRQRFLKASQVFQTNTANIKRLVNQVIYILDDPSVEGYENDGSTIIGDDGVRYWAIMILPQYSDPGNRPLYRALKLALEKWAPAHTVVCLATSSINGVYGPGASPGFFTDGGPNPIVVCACDKDCPRS
jgi:hypothetical protein